MRSLKMKSWNVVDYSLRVRHFKLMLRLVIWLIVNRNILFDAALGPLLILSVMNKQQEKC